MSSLVYEAFNSKQWYAYSKLETRNNPKTGYVSNLWHVSQDLASSLGKFH